MKKLGTVTSGATLSLIPLNVFRRGLTVPNFFTASPGSGHVREVLQFATSRRKPREAGQTAVEFALAYAAVILPLTFAIIFTSEVLLIWHSVNDFTRQGAGYAATHCWTSSASNVTEFMRSHVPPMVNREQFQSGPVEISVTYQGRDPDSGTLTNFQCDGDCSTACVPDTVTVSITGYEFRTLLTALGLPPLRIPDFRTSMPMESAGCDPEQGVCLP